MSARRARPRLSQSDFQRVSRNALQQSTQLLSVWLPGGRRTSAEWVACNPTRSDRRPGSFKVNLLTGRWADFATGDAGGDLISLFAYLNQLTQSGALRKVEAELGIDERG